MKKIMFNDKYGLTQAVLELRKTMTRRIYPFEVLPFVPKKILLNSSHYKIGEVVAIAQAYKDIPWFIERENVCRNMPEYTAGWTNKMFVAAKYMPHHIKITDIKVEQLQDISDEDCLKEGIYVSSTFSKYGIHNGYSPQCANDSKEKKWWFDSPRDAFAALIDKISGKGTWQSNPWCFCYEFELID